ncbi:MAG: hypothetical protein JXQ30_05380 [Spirochaetes bacterium]|nr:hypothetical protein [Spirochaetota bacterium]
MQKETLLIEALWNGESDARLGALASLVEKSRKKEKRVGINLHVHTNESYSVFRSPTEAVWYAFTNGVGYFGINDHYTIAGHAEFGKACRIAGIRAVFSIEAIAMDHEAAADGRRYNDPNNPGRCYLIGKGVTRDLVTGERYDTILSRMKNAIQRRNRKIIELLNRHAAGKGYPVDLCYEDVSALTPRGNATERHVVQAYCEKLDSLAGGKRNRLDIYRGAVGEAVSEATLSDPADLLNTVRAELVKAGKPCYVEEDPEAFASMEDLIGIYKEYGAVPTYPFMGHPVTEEEKDLDRLFRKVTGYRMYAFDLVEFRTSLETASTIISYAENKGFPVFVGTEHNTKRLDPMVGEIARDPLLRGYLKKSANFVLGHQILTRVLDYGYLTESGTPRIGNLKEGFDLYSSVGAMDLPPERIGEIERMDARAAKKVLGID